MNTQQNNRQDLEEKLKAIVGGGGHEDWFMELEQFIQQREQIVREEVGELLTEKEGVFKRSLGSVGYHNSFGSGYDQGIIEGLRLALEALNTNSEEES